MSEVIQSPLNKTISDKFIFVMNLPECLKNIQNKYIQAISEAGIGKNAITWSLTNVEIPRNSIKAQSIAYGGGHVYISSHTKTPYDALKIEFKIDNKYVKKYISSEIPSASIVTPYKTCRTYIFFNNRFIIQWFISY